MNDLEFDVLDELYFVISYPDLAEACGLSDEELIATLQDLYQKGWIKVLNSVDEEVKSSEMDLTADFAAYYYLATKNGLLAHNRA